MKTYLLNLWDAARASYWFVPSLFAVAALFFSFVMPFVDQAIVDSKVSETHLALLPFDHSVTVVIEHEDNEVELQPNGRFQFLGIHQVTAIATHRHDSTIGMHEASCHRCRQTRAHRRECIVE